jgi:NADH:ubiquinone oxidoreductase subunit E
MLVTEREQLIREVRDLADRLGHDRASLMPILQRVKATYSQIDPYAMQVIADELDIHPVEVYSVASFYAFLGAGRQGEFVFRLCRTISCDLQGKDRIARQLENDLGIGFGETTDDGKFTLEWANCMGMCDQGPALLVNDGVYTQLTAEKVHQIIEDCRRTFGVFAPEHKKEYAEWSPQPRVR